MFLRAVTEALLHMRRTGEGRMHPEALASAAAFTAAQIDALPGTLRWKLRTGLAVFRILVAVRYLRPFARLPVDTRARVIGAWAYGPASITRMLFKPVRAIALLSYYEYAPAAAAEGRPS